MLILLGVRYLFFCFLFWGGWGVGVGLWSNRSGILCRSLWKHGITLRKHGINIVKPLTEAYSSQPGGFDPIGNPLTKQKIRCSSKAICKFLFMVLQDFNSAGVIGIIFLLDSAIGHHNTSKHHYVCLFEFPIMEFDPRVLEHPPAHSKHSLCVIGF